MMIHLEDGPAAGRDVDMPEPAARSGHVLVPIYGVYASGAASIAHYRMRRYIEPWTCLVPGIGRTFAALPTHRWFFDGWR